MVQYYYSCVGVCVIALISQVINEMFTEILRGFLWQRSRDKGVKSWRVMDWTIQEGTPKLMGRCIEKLMGEVLTFVNVSNHRYVIPAPISALHYGDIAFR